MSDYSTNRAEKTLGTNQVRHTDGFDASSLNGSAQDDHSSETTENIDSCNIRLRSTEADNRGVRFGDPSDYAASADFHTSPTRKEQFGIGPVYERGHDDDSLDEEQRVSFTMSHDTSDEDFWSAGRRKQRSVRIRNRRPTGFQKLPVEELEALRRECNEPNQEDNLTMEQCPNGEVSDPGNLHMADSSIWRNGRAEATSDSGRRFNLSPMRGKLPQENNCRFGVEKSREVQFSGVYSEECHDDDDQFWDPARREARRRRLVQRRPTGVRNLPQEVLRELQNIAVEPSSPSFGDQSDETESENIPKDVEVDMSNSAPLGNENDRGIPSRENRVGGGIQFGAVTFEDPTEKSDGFFDPQRKEARARRIRSRKATGAVRLDVDSLEELCKEVERTAGTDDANIGGEAMDRHPERIGGRLNARRSVQFTNAEVVSNDSSDGFRSPNRRQVRAARIRNRRPTGLIKLSPDEFAEIQKMEEWRDPMTTTGGANENGHTFSSTTGDSDDVLQDAISRHHEKREANKGDVKQEELASEQQRSSR